MEEIIIPKSTNKKLQMVKKDLNTRGKNSILKFAQFEKGFSPNH